MILDEKKLLKYLANAMNRSLTQIKKEQIKMLVSKLGLETKFIKGKRQRIKRARSKDLNVAIFTTPKYLTPFMFKDQFRPKIPSHFGIATTSQNGKFYSYRHPMSKKSHIKAIPNKISGFGVSTSITTDRGKKRGYSFISKKSILDIEALKLSENLQNEFIKLFDKELNR